jgi:hypothetical protein
MATVGLQYSIINKCNVDETQTRPAYWIFYGYILRQI